MLARVVFPRLDRTSTLPFLHQKAEYIIFDSALIVKPKSGAIKEDELCSTEEMTQP